MSHDAPVGSTSRPPLPAPLDRTALAKDARGHDAPELCAENTQEYYNHKELDVPRADKPDF
jgi:hypothetical protein